MDFFFSFMTSVLLRWNCFPELIFNFFSQGNTLHKMGLKYVHKLRNADEKFLF